MGHSIYFFAMDGKSVAERLASESSQVLEATEKLIREKEEFSEEAIKSTLGKAAEICQGQLPAVCDEEYFDALCWLAEAASEKVDICCF